MKTVYDLNIRGDVEVLRLRPGDKLIVTLERQLSHEGMQLLREALKETFPDNEAVIVAPGLQFTMQTGEHDQESPA